MNAVVQLRGSLPIAPLCAALGVSRATVNRRLHPVTPKPVTVRPKPVRALSDEERQRIAQTLCEDRFVDRSPTEVYYTLLDEGRYLGSERTFYRVLAERASTQERRNQLRHPPHQRPELVASGTNEVWSWDTSKLRTTTKWQYFYLYVLLDLYSRYAVGWMIARHDNAALAKVLIRGARQGSCRLIHAANDCLSMLAECVLMTTSRSGLRVTAPIGDQFRVAPDQRAGLRSRALR